MGPSRSCWNGTTSAFQPEEITWKGTRVSCVYYQKKVPIQKKSGNLSYALRTFGEIVITVGNRPSEPKFKSWLKLFVFHLMLMLLRKV